MTPVVLLYYSVGSVVIHGVATEAGFPFYMTIALFSIKKHFSWCLIISYIICRLHLVFDLSDWGVA